MEDLCKYVPDGQHVAFAGDQLTSCRTRTARRVRVNSKGVKSLRGLVPFAVDWHCKVNFIEVHVYIYNSFDITACV